MNERIVLLGTKGGPAIRPGGPSPTSSLIETGGRVIAVDCALGVSRGIVNAGVSLKGLSHVLVTHLHSDHVLELGGLIHTAWTSGLATPVKVYGPKGVVALWQAFLASLVVDISTRIVDEGRPVLADLVTVAEIDAGVVLEEPGLRVTALRVPHPPLADCFAFRVEMTSGVVVFSGDTAFHPPLADFAKGADLLIHEAMLPEGLESIIRRTGNGTRLREHLVASHTFAADVGRIATMAGVKRLALNHMIPADDPDFTEAHWHAAVSETYSGDLIVGRDGLEIRL
ncbi:MBL fold metallo-hydrolase [Rhizobium sp. C4]|uniref:MBL fold metallo-hydrolase n=1 Tax=Rhizobium sp. C4 TaxID=1349800 RepID=UPI001E31DBA1|nr:MBL fold metallo-hydrolase [Rhizobium sp. C4]MCD2173348.1 MBL fold metallo-hydrolase [Rhizobium sp. C4]